MKQVLFIFVFCIFCSFKSVPKLEDSLTESQRVEYIDVTSNYVKTWNRINSREYSHPVFRDDEGNMFMVILCDGGVYTIPTEAFDYAEN